MILKLNLIITTLLLTINSINAQDIDSTNDLKKGIYKNFEEFKTNNPSSQLEYNILNTHVKYGGLGSNKSLTQYKLNIDKNDAESIGQIYGFCDSKNIYINDEIIKLKPKSLFSKLNYIGKYCLFEKVTFQDVNTGNGNLIVSRKSDIVLNMDNGETRILNKSYLKKILKTDKELYLEFKKRKKKHKILREYLIKYLERKN